MPATLFLSGNDLSEKYNLQDVFVRRMKTNTFDVYCMIHNSDIEIKVRGRRGPSELIKEDPVKGNTYVAGESYDSFDVWVSNKEGLRWSSRCIAEDLRSFDTAVQVALRHNEQLNVASGSF